jgi:hypothetical protein
MGRGFGGGNLHFSDKRGELPSYRRIEIYWDGIGCRAGFFLISGG